jgi:hypothetical protein
MLSALNFFCLVCPRVVASSNPGFDGEEQLNAESVRQRGLANAFSVEFLLSRMSQGCRKLQPWAEICERLRRYFKLNHCPTPTLPYTNTALHQHYPTPTLPYTNTTLHQHCPTPTLPL